MKPVPVLLEMVKHIVNEIMLGECMFYSKIWAYQINFVKFIVTSSLVFFRFNASLHRSRSFSLYLVHYIVQTNGNSSNEKIDDDYLPMRHSNITYLYVYFPRRIFTFVNSREFLQVAGTPVDWFIRRYSRIQKFSKWRFSGFISNYSWSSRLIRANYGSTEITVSRLFIQLTERQICRIFTTKST